MSGEMAISIGPIYRTKIAKEQERNNEVSVDFLGF